MRRNAGFTLVELLVVVAIIAILAGIVLPRVGPYIAKARMTRAQAEIRSMEAAIQKMLTDTNRDSFAGNRFFSNWNAFNGDTIPDQVNRYTNAFYILLKNGKNSDLTPTGLELHADVRSKLGTSYIDIGFDPWNQLYQFYAGPWAIPGEDIPFRIYRADPTIPGGPASKPDDSYGPVAEVDLDGNPTGEQVGFQANRDMTMYIWSKGQNLDSNQGFDPPGDSPDYVGGGDDINNWDTSASWSAFYS